ncbi:zona pellucida sperm-binding protein 3-like [Triplophysa dalaica]|uniref:zona pellucida sperm-binding protein 3-like n=1 Tax=Triplophysa dalaica TaxID=1582913 RepID=UPI0024DF49D9|nr:zona pellucida sperm-binding protein 3-like [Triplophysa dalaica]
MKNLLLWVFISTVVTAIGVSEDDIQIVCEESSVRIRWKVNKSMHGNPPGLLLGNCFPTSFTDTSKGHAEAEFIYQLSDCQFKRMGTWKYLIYANTLTHRPLSKTSPPFTYPVRCVYDRPQGWTPFYQSPAQGHGELAYHMAILNQNFSGPAESNVFPLGSFIPIWAEVDQQAHQPLVLLLEECVASTTLEMYPDTLTYPLITNEGCLVEGKKTFSRFLPRYHSSSILLHLQAFRFAVGEEVYIHCKLIAWDPEDLNESRKACNYNKTTEKWELLDNSKKNQLCQCCDSTCKGRPKRDAESAPQGLVLKSVLGPLTITED